jgi:hypothetical protein
MEMIASLKSKLLSLSPYALYSFDDINNICNDSSGNNLHGTLGSGGGVYLAVDPLMGNYINTVTTGFTGITLPSLTIGGSSGLTMVAVYRLASTQFSTELSPLCSFSNTGSTNLVIFEVGTTGYVKLYNEGWPVTLTSALDGNWAVAITNVRSDGWMGVSTNRNPILVNTNTHIVTNTLRTRCYLAYNGGSQANLVSNYSFIGALAGVAIYKTSLSAVDMEGIYTSCADLYKAATTKIEYNLHILPPKIPVITGLKDEPVTPHVHFVMEEGKVIAGTATKGGVISPYTRVWLRDRRTGSHIGAQRTNLLGEYRFTNVPVNQDGYLVIGFDDTQTYDPVVKDFL